MDIPVSNGTESIDIHIKRYSIKEDDHSFYIYVSCTAFSGNASESASMRIKCETLTTAYGGTYETQVFSHALAAGNEVKFYVTGSSDGRVNNATQGKSNTDNLFASGLGRVIGRPGGRDFPEGSIDTDFIPSSDVYSNYYAWALKDRQAGEYVSYDYQWDFEELTLYDPPVHKDYENGLGAYFPDNDEQEGRRIYRYILDFEEEEPYESFFNGSYLISNGCDEDIFIYSAQKDKFTFYSYDSIFQMVNPENGFIPHVYIFLPNVTELEIVLSPGDDRETYVDGYATSEFEVPMFIFAPQANVYVEALDDFYGSIYGKSIDFNLLMNAANLYYTSPRQETLYKIVPFVSGDEIDILRIDMGSKRWID
jgi:hypothetical protein